MRLSFAQKAISVVAFTALAVAAPAAALAVNVSSSDGSGSQSVTTWYSNGATVAGNLKSTSGSNVYYSGATVLNNCEDPVYGRYSSNTSSTTAVSRGGTFTKSNGSWPCSFDGVKMRVCKDVNNLPDPCGGWSSTIVKP